MRATPRRCALASTRDGRSSEYAYVGFARAHYPSDTSAPLLPHFLARRIAIKISILVVKVKADKKTSADKVVRHFKENNFASWPSS